ncbi:MAG: valine--tRNA ligase [Hyphococcus sp.]|nr:MAG: valine--tRNA ligase [Marinicaulis sp.]
MLDKNFNFAEAESQLYQAWEEAKAFQPSDKPGADPYTIVIPPPNVTGSLHMGHALNNTLQDILCRFERMRGKSVLWQPGMDHAGIATQMVVERQLMEQQQPGRRDMGREKFVERVWSWKEESGGQILNQLKRLGASCDWTRERFTMDEGLSEAVKKVFVQLYKEGLIYRDKRLVNWDPKFLTAISDLEVENTEVDGHFWHLKYPLADGVTYEFTTKATEDEPARTETRGFIEVATTRPETMLGDTGVAVHPDDERYKDLIGKFIDHPLTGRRIKIVADEHADPEQGSGAVKITPAHDFNDFEVGKRTGLEAISILNEDATINDNAPEAYRGLDRFEARKKIVADLQKLGLLSAIEDKKIMQPFGDRSGVVIEPMLTDQWYVDAETLAKPAIAAVETGKTNFVPGNWSKTYFQWMRNIQPWCISRQLWWGHRIPAWYGPPRQKGGVVTDIPKPFVAETEAEAVKLAEEYYDCPVGVTEDIYSAEREIDENNNLIMKKALLKRDEDVLDTWFSSALWPFSTLGWPDQTPELEKHYPTSVLVTAHDIIFFWVARMMMMGLHFKQEIPFPEVLIHGLVVDEQGQKMSKSKGNGVDPLELIEKFGADALRFSLASQAAQGRNVRISEARVEGYRNFATKLWNAARFCQMNECAPDPSFDPSTVQSTLNQWIVHEANECAAAVTRDLDAYRFNDAAGAVYKFIWNVYCDWYLELAKPTFQGEDEAAKAETRKAAAWAMGQILALLHPFMPFVTEELWSAFGASDGEGSDNLLVVAKWPTHKSELTNTNANEEMNWVIDLITNIRSVRQEMNVPAGAKIPMVFIGDGARIERHREIVSRLARLSEITLADAAPKGAVQIVHGDATVALPMAGVIDLEAEQGRLEKEIAKIKGEITGIDKKLANKNFVDKAPKAVVEEQHTRRADFEVQLEKLDAALERLKAM